MKKVLLIADSNMSLSGVPVVYMSIVRNLSDEYIFDIIVFKNDDMHFKNEFLSYGGKIFYFHFSKPNSIKEKFVWLYSKYPKCVQEFLHKEIRLTDYDILHCFNEEYSYPFIKEAKKAGVKKTIIHINSAASAYRKRISIKSILLQQYQKKAFKNCDSIIFVSEQSFKKSNYKKKGTVIYNTYDEKYNKIVECEHNNLVLTQIGTFSSRKNQKFSVDVLAEIRKTNSKAKLYFVGKELNDISQKDYLLELKKYIEEKALEKDIIFLPSDTDKVALYQNTSFVLLPSTMESFGLVLTESQASGIHCFANSNLPRDTNIGNIDYLKLDAFLWSAKILDYFKKNGNLRKLPMDKERFSIKVFKEKIKSLYKSN